MKRPHINQKRFQEFLYSLPANVQNEVFDCFGLVQYSIPKALFVIKELNLVPIELNVFSCCEPLTLHLPASTSESYFTGVSDEAVCSDAINLSIPIIIVQHAWNPRKREAEDCGSIIIDGHKRLRKAFLQGREVIGGYNIPTNFAELACTRLKEI
jgi:hypothetical protein